MQFAAIKDRVQSAASGLWAKRPGFMRGRSLFLTAGAGALV